MLDAVQWCEENGKSGYSAWKTGLFPLVKSYKTIDKRLNGTVKTGEEKAYCSILIQEEENCLVNYVKNKNRAYQGINKASLTKIILDVLKIRQYLNKSKKGGRIYKKLNRNAKNALMTGRYVVLSTVICEQLSILGGYKKKKGGQTGSTLHLRRLKMR